MILDFLECFDSSDFFESLKSLVFHKWLDFSDLLNFLECFDSDKLFPFNNIGFFYPNYLLELGIKKNKNKVYNTKNKISPEINPVVSS